MYFAFTHVSFGADFKGIIYLSVAWVTVKLYSGYLTDKIFNKNLRFKAPFFVSTAVKSLQWYNRRNNNLNGSHL